MPGVVRTLGPVTPYLFAPSVVRARVPRGRAGAYVLGSAPGGDFRAEYVGRSDACVRERLATHERLGEFDYFIVRLADGATEAHVLECGFWHACAQGDVALRNAIHPAAPRGSGLACPYCHFAEHVVEVLRAA